MTAAKGLYLNGPDSLQRLKIVFANSLFVRLVPIFIHRISWAYAAAYILSYG